MSTHNKLSEKSWIEIRTRYEMGDQVKPLAREYEISPGTIRARRDKENWQPILKDKIQKFSEVIKLINETNAGLIAEQLQGLAESVSYSRMPVVQKRLQDEVSLIGDFKQFLNKAANMNLRCLNELDSPDVDLRTKVAGLSTLKATFKDLADIRTPPELPLEGAESPQDKPLEIVFVKKVKDDSISGSGDLNDS